MQVTANPFGTIHRCSSLLMMLALVWLTVSLPVVARAQRVLAEKTQTEQSGGLNEEDNSNPLSGATEEKTPSPNTLSEYLHEMAQLRHPVSALNRSYMQLHSSLYIAYHGELLVPPPNC